MKNVKYISTDTPDIFSSIEGNIIYEDGGPFRKVLYVKDDLVIVSSPSWGVDADGRNTLCQAEEFLHREDFIKDFGDHVVDFEGRFA